ncbi:dihydroxyacetone kinase subunit DhaK [Prodigiosinella confusarubida]|uniref:Dihydroxyacetone kinase subunit DhaK n=1 Tax=Serratia sp. (strain ATCC 39006) TaxID=104623 RepID=A0A2I5TED5_SERS3|nr:dihydroxyacetone kinase subunit DhaK [Serratia sp. ATCC 39006]AUG98609.1 dihydroxyacetone kinase subunit DhaK [Serratia sp. ATCC 39006]AUH02924.1 dihydroxyacetone kinase subunit DhaK [Serratia sp. ATCC 39006]
MKKIMNHPEHYVDEMLEGLCLAHSEYYQQPVPRVITRRAPAQKGKVGIVTGGGSGHLPIFTGYVGKGLLDAAAVGDVFSSPSSIQMAQAIGYADQGNGVLLLYGNYGGDIMNFDMAAETVDFEKNITCRTVLLSDDVASAPPHEKHKRRGVAGMVYAFKLAGAMAETLASLDEVARVAQKAADATRSIGCALTPCTVPAVGQPTFSLADDEIEMGIGIHGEPGIWRDKLRSADEIADEMLQRLLDDMPLASGDEITLLVNSLGATPPEELYILYRHLHQRLNALGITLVMPLVGHYATSMEMTGATLTICKLDAELKALLQQPAQCAFWTVSA